MVKSKLGLRRLIEGNGEKGGEVFVGYANGGSQWLPTYLSFVIANYQTQNCVVQLAK